MIKLNDEIKHGAFVYIYHFHHSNNYSVEPLWAFPDKTIYFQLQWGEVCSTLVRLTELINNGTIVGFPPENSQIVDYTRFVFRITEVDSRVNSDDILLEIKDVWKQFASEPDSLDLCRSAVRQYCETLTEESLTNLRETYFSIPNSRRSFLLSMDAKDHLVRQILATEDKNQIQELTVRLKEEIEYSWSKEVN